MWPNLIECLESDLNIKNKLSYLNTTVNVHGLNLEGENDINLVKSKVKEFCADVTTRTEGLLLLYAVVHCSSTLYVDNWSQIVLGSLRCPDSIIPKEIPLKVLNRMLINFGKDSDYEDVFSKVINDIFPFLLDPEDDKIYIYSCQSLAVCMRYAPKEAGAHVASIEKLLLKELDSPYGQFAEAIGECFAALPMCISHVPKTSPSEYKEIWCDIFTKIMNTMHSLLNSIMKLSEDQAEFVDVSGLPLFDIPFDSNSPVIQTDIFKSLCQCMAKMISSENQLVRLPITELLKTLFRVFSIEKIVQDQNQDTMVGNLKLCFSQMLNGVYVVLEALILNFNIFEQSHNFLVLMNMSLSAMEKTFSQSSSVSQVRGSTWKLINIWLVQYGSKAADGISKNKNIIGEILKDIDIDIAETENVKSKQLKTRNVKAENQKANKVFACTHALKVLKSLVEIGTDFMEKHDLDKICSILLRISKVVLRHMLPKKHIPFPYSDENCRKMLFDALCTYVIHSDPLHSKYIMEAQNIFNSVSRDASAKVGRLCHRFRKLSRYYLNPRKPPPDAIQYSHPSMLNTASSPVIDNIKHEWGNGINWSGTNGPSNDDQMDDNEVAQVEEENAYSDKSESDLLPIEQVEESENHVNHEYRRIAKQSSQSMGEEESIDDSDIEPTYVSTESNHPQRIGINDSPPVNSFGMQSCAEQYANETRTERHVSEAVVPNLTNNVENNIEEHVSAFVEVKSAGQKPPQAPMGNGEWKKKENLNESSTDDSDMEDEGDEEAEVNEESDNAGDEASEGKRSPEFDEERPRKRQKCMDEEGDDDIDEEVEDEDIPVNNQSSDEDDDAKNGPVLEQNADTTGNLNDEESRDDNEDIDCKSPTIREMCGDFVLAEPTASDIS